MDNLFNKKEYNVMILSGGSIKGFGMLGAIQYLIDQKMIENINTYIGCSVGSMIAYLLIIGFKPNEIISKIISEKILDHFTKINISKLSKGLGCFDWKHIEDFLLNMTFEKCDEPLTFEDLYNKFGKKLVCSTFNINTDKTEYLSIDTTPKLLCIAAIRMSSNIPFLFKRYMYKSCYYIDGGIVDNFPIKYEILCQDIPEPNIIGINLMKFEPIEHIPTQDNNLEELFEDGVEDTEEYNIKEYFGHILKIIMSYHIDRIIKDFDKKKIDMVKLNVNVNTINFKLSSKEMLDIFSEGYQTISKKYIA